MEVKEMKLKMKRSLKLYPSLLTIRPENFKQILYCIIGNLWMLMKATCGKWSRKIIKSDAEAALKQRTIA
jgi:hypothetical protein